MASMSHKTVPEETGVVVVGLMGATTTSVPPYQILNRVMGRPIAVHFSAVCTLTYIFHLQSLKASKNRSFLSLGELEDIHSSYDEHNHVLYLLLTSPLDSPAFMQRLLSADALLPMSPDVCRDKARQREDRGETGR